MLTDVRYRTVIIEPLVGVGDVRLGAESAAVERELGKPDAVAYFEEDDETEWSYPQRGLSVGFNAHGAPHVVSITVNNPEATLFGERVIGAPEQDFMAAMRAKGIPVELTDWSNDDGSAKFFVLSGVQVFVATEFGRVSAIICENTAT